MDIRLFRNDDLDDAAALIARLNVQPEHNIVYMGDDAEEIKDAFANDLRDLPPDQGVMVATEGDKLVGLWGAEMDNSRGRAYMWGPLVDHNDWYTVAERLHGALAEVIPGGTNWYQIGIDSRNVRVRELAPRFGYALSERRHYFMRLTRENLSPVPSDRVIEVTEKTRSAFADLHDKLFPETYYNGAELVERLNENRRAWVTDDLQGYVYVECKPDHGWASLEFIGVDEGGRGQGYGKALITTASEWLLSHPKVATVDLNVASDNPAVHLYKKSGFLIEKEIVVYQKEG